MKNTFYLAIFSLCLAISIGLYGCTSSTSLPRESTTTAAVTTTSTATVTTTTAAGTTTTTGAGPTTTTTPTSSTTTTTTPIATYTVSGEALIAGLGIRGVVVTIEGFGTTTTDASGKFSFSSVPSGFWSLQFSQTGWTFNPASSSFVLIGNLTRNTSGETTDWTAQKIGTDYLTAITSVTAGTFVVGGNSSVILQSTDGGTSWMTAFTNNPTTEPLIACFPMGGDKMGVLNNKGALYQSNAGVTTWGFYAQLVNTTEALVDFRATGNYTWEVVTEIGKIYWTNNGGTTLIGSFVNGIQMVDDFTMIAAGRNGYLSYYDGSSWMDLSPGGSDDLQKALVDSDSWLAVSSQGSIYQSIGSTPFPSWTKVLAGFPATFEGIYIPSAPTLEGSIVCGSNGWILKHK
jgi:photosystem II stability/assembly factor-like uncharacterized protein